MSNNSDRITFDNPLTDIFYSSDVTNFKGYDNNLFYLTYQAQHANLINNKSTTFLRIYTFAIKETVIFDEFFNGNKNKYKMIFDTYGNLILYQEPFDIKNIDTILHYNNPLTGNYIAGNPVEADIKTPDSINGRRDFILCTGKKWILYKYTINNKNKYSILYNPIHGKSFGEYYTKLSESGDKPVVKQEIDTRLLPKYCYISNNQNNQDVLNNDYSDSYCNCIMPDDCIYTSFGISNTKDNEVAKLASTCYCDNTFCDDIAYADANSFFMKYNYDRTHDHITNVNTCPDVKLTICSEILKNYGTLITNNTSFSQTCGNKNVVDQNDPQSLSIWIIFGIFILINFIILFIILLRKKHKKLNKL